MSKYTTQVRFICENMLGFNEPGTYSDITSTIINTWNKIFDMNIEFFDSKYKSVICQKILLHYYFREIGYETYGLWKIAMNRKLNEIMPYYNQLYESSLLKFNPFNDVDLTREHTRLNLDKHTTNADTTRNDVVTSTSNTTNNATNKSKNLFSNTPQGALTNIENETYLTDARLIYDEGNSSEDNLTKSNTGSDTEFKESKSINSTESYIETLKGKQGTTSYSKLLLELRETFLNIDMMVVHEFTDLFMNIW